MATNSAATSFAALDAASATNLSALRQTEALRGKRVAWASNECSLTSKACSLYFKRPGDPEQRKLYVSSLMPKSVSFVNGVKDYAQALEQLERADAAADVRAAFSEAMGAMSAIAGAVNLPAGGVSTALAKPLSASVGWAFGQYQNELKYEAIRAATKTANPIIQQALPILDAELKFAREAQLAELESNLQEKDDAFSHQANAANLKSEIQAANALNLALSTKPSELFDSMGVAHSKLTAAIANPAENLGSALAAISAFAEQAQTVQQVVKTFLPATKS